MGKLDGRVALVTGASRGIGRDIALAFGREGAKVVVTARTENEGDSRIPGSLAATVRQIREAGGEAIGVRCNVMEDSDIEQLVSKVVAEFGRVDILINNAGINVPGSILEMQIRHWDLIMRVNLRAPFILSRVALPHMIRQGWGHIVNISSTAAIGPGAGPYNETKAWSTPYGVTKKALERFSQGLAREVWEQNVAVNVLYPAGGIASEGVVYLRSANREEMKGWRPDGEMMADAAVAICAKEPKTFTGQIKSEEVLLREEGVDIARYPRI